LLQAEQLCHRVLEVDPNQTEALRVLAQVFCQTGRSDRAIEYLRAVLRVRPSWADAHNDLGLVLISQRKLAEAAICFQEAVRLQPALAAAHNNLGNTLCEMGRPAEAAICLQEAKRLVPAYAEAHYNLGLAFATQHQPAEALASFQEAVRLRPDYAEAHLQIGKVFKALGKRADAAASFQRVLRLRPEIAQTCSQLELVPAGGFQVQVSAATSTKAPLPGTDNSKAPAIENVVDEESVNAIANDQQMLRDPEALAEVPDDICLDAPSAKQFHDAEMTWEKTLHLKSDYARLHYYLASMLEKQGRSKSALAHYEEVIRLEPDHAETSLRIRIIRKAGNFLVEANEPDKNAIRVRAKKNVSALPMTATIEADRHNASTVSEQYERWERCLHHCESSPEGGEQVLARPGDQAVLDIYFGHLAGTPASPMERCGTEPLLESMPERAERRDQMRTDAFAR
jgi:tetratricopeptide (TPR) repeat protein